MNLTEGSISKKLILFSLPMIVGNILQQVYNLADTMIVGKFIGADALAAVGSSYTLMVFLTSVIIGLCMGSGALFSEAYGAGNMERLREDIGLSFVFILGVTALMYLMLFPFKNAILLILRIPSDIFELTSGYVGVIFTGIIFVMLYNFFAYLLRSRGNSFIPLVFLAASSLVNIALDLIFVINLNLGVRGAALATVIAQALAGIGIMVYSLATLPLLREGLFIHEVRLQRLGKIVRNDLATAMQQSIMNFGILMIQGLVNSFGTIVMAAFAAAVKIDTIAYMPAQEFGNAYSMFVSQNHGANKPERIKRGTRTAFLMSIIFCAVASAVIFIFAGDLMLCFINPGEKEILAHGIRYLRIEGAAYIGIGMLFLWYGYYRGIGRPEISLVLTIISLGTRVLLSYTLAPHTPLGVNAIWISIPIGWFLADAAGAMIRKNSKNLR
ncbi:MAG: MATE family efflux transporter [Eubacteriales bacterium]|nr:MATE family efflux transporter [Eubacteriales bacterium]